MQLKPPVQSLDSGGHPGGRYAAYMIRLWQTSPQEPWRASAQSAHTGEKLHFASFADLIAFFYHHMDAAPGPSSPLPTLPPSV